MGIREDREDFNETGLRGLLRKLMAERDEAFIKVSDGGWRGEVVAERPAPGSGRYLHYKKGFGVIDYPNSGSEDRQCENFRIEV